MESDDKEGLDCPVCMEQYDTGKRTPKMMPCLHTVCATCLVDLTTANPSFSGSLDSGVSTFSLNSSRGSIISNASDEEVFQVSPPVYNSLPSEARRQKFKNRQTNSHTIDNLTSILSGNHHPPLKRVLGSSTESDSDDIPPALPARNAVLRDPPPLTPKPKWISQKAVFSDTGPLVKQVEPDIQRKITFHCPLCRTPVDSSTLQTNRYVVAHLRDLERLKKMNHYPNTSEKGVTKKRYSNFIHEDFWCETCGKPCGKDCESHTFQPMEEYIGKVNTSLQDILGKVEERLVDHIQSEHETEEVFKTISDSLNKASRHMWRMNQLTLEVKENLSALKDYINSSAESPTSLQHALALTSKVECVRKLDMQLSTLECGTNSDEIYIWRQNNKVYISTSEPDQTIMITINESNSQTID